MPMGVKNPSLPRVPNTHQSELLPTFGDKVLAAAIACKVYIVSVAMYASQKYVYAC